MTNCGFDLVTAKSIEANYHELYKESDDWVQNNLKQAAKLGYITGAFGLRVRTPIMKQVLWGSKKIPYEAAAESRTAGNALGQSYCLLNNRSQNEFLKRVYNSPYKLNIQPIAAIHDSQYYLIKNDPETVKFVNDNLIECMSWQDDPAIAHDQVKLGAELMIFYPSWADEIPVPNNSSIEDIKEILNKLPLAVF